MRLVIICFLLLSIDPAAQIALAETSMQSEIEYLKKQIADSGCQFERNGDRFNAQKALEHIQIKQDYFADDIDSTERFIELAATKSTFSGRYYKILCADKPEKSLNEWLYIKLEGFEKSLNPVK